MDDQISVELTLDRAEATILLESLERMLETLQRIEVHDGSELYLAAQKEKSAIVPAIMALEAALKTSQQRH